MEDEACSKSPWLEVQALLETKYIHPASPLAKYMRPAWSLAEAEQDANRAATRPSMPEAEYMTGCSIPFG